MGRILGILIILIILALTTAFAVLASARPDMADVGFGTDGPSGRLFQAFQPQYSALLAGAPIDYQRLGLAWDQFGTWNGSQCVVPTETGGQPRTFIAGVAKVEQLGETPLVVIGPDIWGGTSGYKWPSGAQTATTPDDHQYQCGVRLMLRALAAQGLSRTGMLVEAFNEPDNRAYYVDPSQAGRYVGDLVAVAGSQVHPIAGGFEGPQNDTYASAYVAALKASGYNASATSWSFHDYGDVVASQSCSPSLPSACDHQGASHFVAWLKGQGEPTSDVWMTESGDASRGGAWLTHTRSEEAHTAYGWEQLRHYVHHVFWYQWQTHAGDGWDSALINASGQRRPSYCVLAFNESPSQALSDSRCPGS
jgi:hypothetical protein